MEFMLQVLVLVIGGNGLLFLLARKWWEKKMKELEYKHISEADEREHRQKLELAQAKKSLTHSLRKLASEKEFLNKVVASYHANYATLIKMSNGSRYGDGEHKWKFSATLESIAGIEVGIYSELQLKPIEEASLLFSRLKETGYVHINILDEKPQTILSNRLEKKGVIAYTIVSTEDMMNSLMLCWFAKDGLEIHGVEQGELRLKQIMGDFRSMEDSLL